MTGLTRGKQLSVWHAPRILAALSATLLVAILVVVGLRATLALFASDYSVSGDIAAARIFRDERLTPAFSVTDASSGSAVDRSSANAFAADARYFLTRSWLASFDGGRYLDFEFNSPLPAALDTQTVSLALRLSSDVGVGSACFYVELRRASTNDLLSTHGSASSPIACTSGTQAVAVTVPLPVVRATDVANDVRLRLYATDSGAGALRLDEATIAGNTPYAAFTLYPILTREAFDGQVELIRWGLAGP